MAKLSKRVQRTRVEEVVGKENICDNVQQALNRAEEVYEGLEAKHVTSTI